MVESFIVQHRVLVKDPQPSFIGSSSRTHSTISPTRYTITDKVCIVNSKKHISVIECIIIKRRMIVKDPQPFLIGGPS